MTAATTPVSTPTRPPRGAWTAMVRSEARLVARDTAGLLLPIGLPVLIMVMNGMGSDGQGLEEFAGMTALDAVVLPATLVMIVALLGVINVPSFLAGHRQYGVLRRLSATPARPAMVLVAQVVVNVALGAVGMAMAVAVAWFGFGSAGPRNLAGTAVTLLLGACALYGTGLIVAAVAPTANAALALGLVLFFGTMAAGGGMLPAEALPTAVAEVGSYLPYGATLHPLRESWIGGSPSPIHLGVLAGYAVAGVVVSARIFRWR